MKRAVAVTLLAFGLAGSGLASAATPEAAPPSNPEMKRIFDADQADRKADGASGDWSQMGKRDAERREQTRRLLADGKLQTGEDYLGAAFVFQHGSGDDYLLAHTLAILATKKGASRGPWIAAATLDRYLQGIGRKQIYGTQTLFSGGQWSKEPFDRDLVSDSLRRELGVPDLAAQDAQFAEMASQGSPLPAAVAPAVKSPPASGSTSLKCDSGPLVRTFVRANWRVFACDNGALLAVGGGVPAATLLVMFDGTRTAVSGQGGDPAEVKVATAAFEAMTQAQINDIAAQARSSKR
jgi:hypothetical protein